MKKQRGSHHGSRVRPTSGPAADRHAPASAPAGPETESPLVAPEEMGRRLGLVAGPGGGGTVPANAQVVPLGYIEGLLWRLVVMPPRGANGDPVPQLQHQHPGSGEWEVVAHDDILAHVTWQAYRRGTHRADEAGHAASGLLLPR